MLFAEIWQPAITLGDFDTFYTACSFIYYAL